MKLHKNFQKTRISTSLDIHVNVVVCIYAFRWMGLQGDTVWNICASSTIAKLISAYGSVRPFPDMKQWHINTKLLLSVGATVEYSSEITNFDAAPRYFKTVGKGRNTDGEKQFLGDHCARSVIGKENNIRNPIGCSSRKADLIHGKQRIQWFLSEHLTAERK